MTIAAVPGQLRFSFKALRRIVTRKMARIAFTKRLEKEGQG